MLKLDTKPGIIFSGIAAIGFTIAHLALADDYYSYGYYLDSMCEIGRHISCLQLLGSVALIVGVFKQNYKLFVPWMISTGLFIYLMTYATIVVLTKSSYIVIVLAMFAPSIVYLTCALYSVKKAFDKMREDQSESRTPASEKKNILSPL